MKTFLTISILIFTFIGCDSPAFKSNQSRKDELFEKMRVLVNVIENREAITNQEWMLFDEEYRQFNVIEYRKLERTFTQFEFEEIKTLRSRYNSRRTRSRAANAIKDGVNNTKQFMYELLN
jgi:hypothetical protein